MSTRVSVYLSAGKRRLLAPLSRGRGVGREQSVQLQRPPEGGAHVAEHGLGILTALTAGLTDCPGAFPTGRAQGGVGHGDQNKDSPPAF